MIKTLSDLLTAILEHDLPELKAEPYKHPVIIGAMYEGLASEILSQAIPEGLDLRVVRGVISFKEGKSGEIDCMIVSGLGHQIPNTDYWDYDCENVIAIIEVKKTLNRKSLGDGLRHLNAFWGMSDSEIPFTRTADDAISVVLRTRIDAIDAGKQLTKLEKHIFDSLVTDSALPVRIIWGLNGQSRRITFRKMLYDIFPTEIDSNTFSTACPDLIIGGVHAFIKLNGLPFGNAVQDDSWSFCGTTDGNSIYLMLQVIWERIADRHPNRELLYVDDKEEEVYRPLAVMYMVEPLRSEIGFFRASENVPEIRLPRPFRPREITPEQAVLINCIGEVKEASLDDPEVQSSFAEGFSSYTDGVDDLLSTGFVYISGNKIKLLTKALRTSFNEGKAYAGEDYKGHLTSFALGEIPDRNKSSRKVLHIVLDNPISGNVLSAAEMEIDENGGVVTADGKAQFFLGRDDHLKRVRERLAEEGKSARKSSKE